MSGLGKTTFGIIGQDLQERMYECEGVCVCRLRRGSLRASVVLWIGTLLALGFLSAEGRRSVTWLSLAKKENVSVSYYHVGI